MTWLEELAIAEFFRAAGGGAIIADDPRCFPLTHALSPAPMRGGGTSKRLVLRRPGGGGWSETSRPASEIIGSSTAPPILIDLSGETGDRSDLTLSAATLIRNRPGAEPPAGFCSEPGAPPGLLVRKDAEARGLWKRIAAALSASTLTPADLYDRLQAFVGECGLVRDISFTEPTGPVARLDPVGCLDRLTAEDACALLCEAGPRWPETDVVRLRIPGFGNAPFRLRIAGFSRNGAPPEVICDGRVSPVSVSGRGWAFALAREQGPGGASFGIELVGEGVLVRQLSVCLPPLAAGGAATADHYDPLSVYASDWWQR